MKSKIIWLLVLLIISIIILYFICGECDFSNWLVAYGTILLATVATLQDIIRSYIQRPELEVEFSLSPPSCHKTMMNYPIQSGAQWNYVPVGCFYFRIIVKNKGDSRAKNIEVVAHELLKLAADEEYKKDDSFVPINLTWSKTGTQNGTPQRIIEIPAINPDMEKYCDIAHINNPDQIKAINPNLQGKFCLDVAFESATLSHLITDGKYKLKLKIGSSNAKTVERFLEINHTGRWFDNEEKMFRDGIGIKLLS